MSTVDHTQVATSGPGVASEESSGRVSGTLDDIRAMLERQQRAGASLFNRMDRVLAVAGTVVLPLGLVAIFLGWYGAARTPLLFEQIPYLISGGLLGVGLMLGGGMLFFGSWLARLAEQDRQASDDLTTALRDLRNAVLERPAVAATAGAPGPTAVGTGGALVATRTGSMVHRPDCSVVASRDDTVIVPPTSEGYRPCKICDPLPAATSAMSA